MYILAYGPDFWASYSKLCRRMGASEVDVDAVLKGVLWILKQNPQAGSRVPETGLWLCKTRRIHRKNVQLPSLRVWYSVLGDVVTIQYIEDFDLML